MAEGGPPEINEQKKQITPLLQKPIVKGEIWYLIDSKWFKQWKKYVGYDSWDSYSAGNDEQNPGPIDNSGILKEDDEDGTQLKEHLIDELDYVLLPKEGWDKLSSWYDVIKGQEPVARKVVEHGMFVKRCKVEVYLTEFKLCEDNKLDKVKTAKFSKADTIETIEKKMRELFSITESAETRLWNKYMTNSYEPLHERSKTVQDAELYQGQILVIEQKNEDGSWNRQLPTSTAYTRSSNKYITNNTSGKSSYGYGSTYATRGGSGTAYNHNSYSGGPKVQPGLCGLSNLGNTCFMNSALQCMSNVPLLTKYFLNDEYKDELNYDNPLGMNGEIAKSYADLLKQMWSGLHNYTIPRNFKMQVGRFAPQFSGFQQQDAQELLAFLLDGLHEDLNRIINKPYIEAKDSDGRQDEIVAEESWINHLKRNHSIIVDLFHGQFKSKLVCPDKECGKVSVTFDPFCFLSLPLPVRKERIMEVFFVGLDGGSKPLQLKVIVRKHGTILDLCKAVSKVTKVSHEYLVVTDVYNHRFHKLFLNNEALNSITDKDTIYIFEVNVTSAEDPDTIVLPIYLREPRVSSYSTSPSYHLFSTPMLIPVPRKGTTYQDLYEHALKKMKWFVSPPDNDDWFHEQIQSDLHNGDSAMGSDSGTEKEEAADAEQDELDGEMIRPSRREKQSEEKPRLFRLTMVNPYGSSEVQKLRDDGGSLKLTNRTYISLDWNQTAKEKFYNERKSEEVLQDESVNLRSNSIKKSTGLQECLRLFLKEEILDEEDAWYCPSCKEHKMASKKFDLWKLPKVLVIHLKRFSCNRYYRDKLDTYVTYPFKDLDLMDVLAGPPGDHGYTYDLEAVVNHYGGLGGGHYTAYAKNAPNNKWYYFDDSSVSSATEDQVLSKAAYVLFYIRQDCLEDFRQNGLASLVKLEEDSMDDESAKNSGSDNDEKMDTN